MNLKELREKRNAAVEKMDVLANKEDLTDEDLVEFEGLEAETKKLSAQIDRLDAVGEAKAKLDVPRPSAGQMQTIEPTADPVATMSAVSPPAPEAPRNFECFEQFLSAVLDARQGLGTDQRLDFHQAPAQRAEQSMGVGSKGGFRVPSEFRDQLLEVDPAETPLLGSAMRLPPGSSPDAKVELPALDQDTNQHGGVTVARLAEGGAFTETDSDMKLVGWTPDEIGAHIALTEKLIRNWSGAMGMARRLLGSALNAHLENEAYNGTGGAAMRGILQSAATYAVNRTTASDFVFADVANMVERKLQRGGRAFWLYNQLLLSSLMQMKDGNNNLVWQNNVRDGAPATLFGLPAMPYEFASAVGSKGDVALVQPDPYYVIKDGAGPFVDMGRINTDFTTGRVRVRIFMSNDGGPWLQAPFKLHNGTEVSPFVVLDVPSS